MSRLLVLIYGVLFVAGSAGRAATIYSNLAAGFDSQNGSVVDGGIYAGQALADAFTPNQAFIPTEVDVAVGVIQGVDTLNVFLAADANGLPGAIVANLQQQASIGAFQPGGIVPYLCASCPVLSANAQYWVMAQQSDFDTINTWSWNVANQYGSGFDLAYNQTASTTGPWTADAVGLRNAFAVLGTPIGTPAPAPEPATFVLIGPVLAVLGLSQMRRTMRRSGGDQR